MTRQEIEEHLLFLMVQEPVQMRSYVGALAPALFTNERRLLFETVSVILPSDMDRLVVEASLKALNPALYGGNLMLDKMFSKKVVFKASRVQTLIDQLFEENARDMCKNVAYDLLQVHSDPSANVFAEMESARIKLIPQVNGSSERDNRSIFDDMLSVQRAKQFVYSHIKPLDDFMKGWEPGELIVLAGSPSMGKTSVALHIFTENVLQGVPVGFFSLEMTDVALMQRVAGMKLCIENSVIRSRALDDVGKRRMRDLEELFAKQRYFINYKERSCSRIVNIMRARAHEGYKLFIVDYLQLMNGTDKNGREQEISQMSRMLKEVAAELDIVVVELSQLSREHTKRTNKRPQLSDLRESGAIEQDADAVIFPYRPAYFNFEHAISSEHESMELIVAKGRHTGTGTVHVSWEGKYTKIH
jgi:replicative DNA helicase